jgi:hypothetical protein
VFHILKTYFLGNALASLPWLGQIESAGVRLFSLRMKNCQPQAPYNSNEQEEFQGIATAFGRNGRDDWI